MRRDGHYIDIRFCDWRLTAKYVSGQGFEGIAMTGGPHTGSENIARTFGEFWDTMAKLELI